MRRSKSRAPPSGDDGSDERSAGMFIIVVLFRAHLSLESPSSITKTAAVQAWKNPYKILQTGGYLQRNDMKFGTWDISGKRRGGYRHLSGRELNPRLRVEFLGDEIKQWKGNQSVTVRLSVL